MYITAADINDVYPDETQDLTVEQVNFAIQTGEAELDSTLAVRFLTPFQLPLNDLLKSILMDLVRYRLMAVGRPYNSESAGDVNSRYENAKALMASLVNGERVIAGLAVNPQPIATPNILPVAANLGFSPPNKATRNMVGNY